MPISHVLVLGAGPAGLSAALAITQLQSSPPIRVTVLELRPSTTTTVVGGSVNLTPLALRYLDRLGAGARVRALGTPVRSGVDFVSLRTGKVLGVLWKGVDGLRVMRSDVVASMREVAERSEGIDVRYGVRVVSVREEGDEGTGEVVVGLEGGEEMRGDILLGCDGLHSAARHLYVEPERKKEYSGRVVAMAFARVEVAGDVGLRRHGGQTAFADSAMLTGRYGAMVMSFYEPTREKMFMGAVMDMEQEHGGENERDGWKAKGADKARVKEEVIRRFGNTAVAGFAEMLEAQDDWTLWPVYLLPPGGRWSKGRVLLLGDAAHTVSLLRLSALSLTVLANVTLLDAADGRKHRNGC
jgi:2-polyprenyl-6-methoxyphenol hydroxylase-like FAD-dependent oxidoreductase